MLHCLIGYSAFSISECPEGDMSTIFATIMWVCVSLQLYVLIIVCVCVFVCLCLCVCMCVCMLEVYQYGDFDFYHYRLYCCQDLPITDH